MLGGFHFCNKREYIDCLFPGPQASDVKACVYSWEENITIMKKLVTLLNSYTPPDIRKISIGEFSNFYWHSFVFVDFNASS